VRLLLPSPGSSELVIPEWNGNEFLLTGGQRPIIRTFTPRRVDSKRLELDLDIVIHDGGAVSSWIGGAGLGDAAAISGPGRGYTVEPGATSFVLAGDETAIPAISQILEALPPAAAVSVVVEVRHPQARLELPHHVGATIDWVERPSGTAPGDALIAAIERTQIDVGAKVWVAGEAAALHKIRRHLFDVRGLARADVTARGYWKHGR
jgi:NADPH-dependent ferric siderophore reductase